MEVLIGLRWLLRHQEIRQKATTVPPWSLVKKSEILILSSYNSRNLLESTYTTFKVLQARVLDTMPLNASSFSLLRRHTVGPKLVPTLLALGIGLSLSISACSPPDSTEANSVDAEQTTADTTSTSDSSNIYTESGVAIKGADPVAYFTEETFVEGSADYTHEWGGATWQFSTLENRDLFAANPEQYAPQYGGYCAWAVGQNTLAAIDPNAWSIVDDKLYLNANERIQERWSKDIPGNIALAEENWPSLSQQ